MKVFGAQHQRFDGLVSMYAAAQPAVGKFIDPDDSILRSVKAASPTTTIVRIYTGSPTIDDREQHPDPERYGYDYASLVYSRVKDPAHMDYLETENEPNDHYADLTEFIRRLNAFLVGFSRRAGELGFRPLGPNFSTGYPECYIPGSDYVLWPNAWQGLSDGLRALRNVNGALSLHEYDAPDLFRLWSDTKQLGYLVGRHKAIYRCLPSDLQSLPLYITEFGIDFLTQGIEGGFWHNRGEDAPAWMVGQMREAWRRVYSTTPQLRGLTFFLWGRNSAQWGEYDIARTDTSISAFTAFFGEDLPGGVPVTIPYTGKLPFAGGYRITQAYGANPAYYAQFGLAGHEGADVIPLDADWTIHAIEPGTVIVRSIFGNYGNHVVIWNPTTSRLWWYCHLDSFAVALGQPIVKGSALGRMGATGNTQGAHLHLGLQLADGAGKAVNTNNGNLGFVDPIPALAGTIGESPMSTPQERINAAWGSDGVSWNPDAAFPKRARELKLGRAVANEFEYTAADGLLMSGQGFDAAFLECVKGDWGNIKAYDWLTGEVYVPPAPPVPPGSEIVLPFTIPSALLAIGASATEGSAIAGQPFYRLSGAAVRSGVSAFCKVTVIGKGGVPAVGVQVCNIFPDGNGEVLLTGGDGSLSFNYGAASAFTPPASGPFTVFIASGAVKTDGPPKRVTWQRKLSDTIVSLGDPNGEHTEAYVQFVQQ